MGHFRSSYSMGQDNSTPSPSSEDVQVLSLLRFCDSREFEIGQIREIIHYKETDQPGETEID